MTRNLKRCKLDKADILFLIGITIMGALIRLSLRKVVTDDWVMYWDPWLNSFHELGGFKALATDFYDYAPPFMYILYFISIIPLNPMTAYKGVVCIFDLLLAIMAARIIWNITESKVKTLITYGIMLLVPTFFANSALWAQCDAIYTVFVLLAVFYLLKDKSGRAMIFYGIAFAFKLQTLFIFPALLILWAKKKIKIQHFLWIPAMYLLGMVPAWIAGRPFMELINIYVAQGQQDVYALSLKWANIYQILGIDTFLYEYTGAGMWLILSILMVILFYMVYKKYTISKEFFLEMLVFFGLLTIYFLPHMHERYAYLADAFIIMLAIINPRKAYLALAHIIVSFSTYMMYLAKNFTIPLPYYAVVELAIIIILGVDIYKYIKKEEDENGIQPLTEGGN